MFRFILAFFLGSLAVPAQAGGASSNLPSLALNPPVLPSTHGNGIYFGTSNYIVSGDAKARLARTPNSANEKTGAGAAGDLHVSLHMFTGIVAGGVIRH